MRPDSSVIMGHYWDVTKCPCLGTEHWDVIDVIMGHYRDQTDSSVTMGHYWLSVPTWILRYHWHYRTPLYPDSSVLHITGHYWDVTDVSQHVYWSLETRLKCPYSNGTLLTIFGYYWDVTPIKLQSSVCACLLVATETRLKCPYNVGHYFEHYWDVTQVSMHACRDTIETGFKYFLVLGVMSMRPKTQLRRDSCVLIHRTIDSIHVV